MIAIPYLVLFIVSLTFQVLANKKKNESFAGIGYITGALCGLYVVFMIWLWAGWGEGSRASYVVMINGRPAYFGLTAIFPLVVFAFILIPMGTYGIKWVATLLTNFVYVDKDNKNVVRVIEAQGTMLTDAAKFIISLCFLVVLCCAGFLPLFLIFHELQYYDSFAKYVAGEFIHFSFCGLLTAIWLLFVIRFIVNKVILTLRKKRNG